MRVAWCVDVCLVLALVCGVAAPAAAENMIVEKKTFELPSYTTEGGQVIAPVKIGWESYGTLNADKSNAILIAHYFSGTSHAAGRYAASDPAAGYWDYLIGPGKAIDTNKYFVLSSDTLVNLSPGDPHVVTTGPASIEPATGKPYGMRFPLVTIRDFVNVQKALVDSLGIKKLHAVMGASMGGLQTYVWAASYPDMMERIMPVISAGAADPWLIAWVGLWGAPITADPNWNKGDYYGHTPPTAGLKLALKLITLQANHWQWAEATFGRAPAVADVDPAAAFANSYKIEAYLEQAAETRAKVADANHLLYLVKANQTYAAGATGTLEDMKKVKAKTLIIYSPTDQVFAAAWVKATAAALKAAGTPVETAEVEGPYGHLNGVLSLAPLAPTIERFLTE